MSNNKKSIVDAYCNGCNAFICDELVTFEETCSNCGTQIEYFEDKMSNNKQSSVEWLVSQLKISTYWNTLIAELEFMDLEIDDIIEQAKEMEKEQHSKTWNNALEAFKKKLELLKQTYGGNK